MTNDTELAQLEQDKGENEVFANNIVDEELRKPLLSEIARKKHFKEKFERERDSRMKVEEELSKLKAQPAVPAPEKPSSTQVHSDDMMTTLELKAQGLSDEEILKLFQYSRKTNISASELAKDSIFKAGFEKLRADKKVEQATPSPTDRSGGVLYGNKSIRDMKPDEIKSNFENIKNQFRGSNSRSNQ